MKNCENCKFCIFADNGYSNYTVEGTDFICAKKAHPDGVFDSWYGEDKRLEFAEKCPSFEEGEPVEMDVDMENLDELSAEQLEIWNMQE